ncbi:apolipoprotein N-acyltransferase [Rhizosaccharibacter radicis]|uniref:Apolipoprotein N-acyltransferase n=1 Tax=Rhizosaccharibacter radicis TaxID=2782605 RepID=A0ABT1W1Q1_9PROT|nr:apolipoprotein N-acyltransferase [Acetobacteraceae bacterium KSS12]
MNVVAPPAGERSSAHGFSTRALRRIPGWLRLILAGALCALALPPCFVLPVLWVGVPFLMRQSLAATGWRAAAWRGFLFGMGLHTAGLYWLTDAILVRADQFWWFVPFAAPLCAVPLACFIAAGCALFRLVAGADAGPGTGTDTGAGTFTGTGGGARLLLFAGLWTLGDLLRSVVFTGFPWNLWGSVWEWPGLGGTVMTQPAAWVSVHGLTLFTLLLAGAPTLGRRGVAGALAGIVVWAAAGAARLALLHPVGGPSPTVVLVQGDIPEHEKQDRAYALDTFRTYLRLSAAGVAEALRRDHGPVVFVWPETMFPGLLDQDPEARAVMMNATPGAAAALIGSVRWGTDERPRNSLMVVVPGGNITDTYDKAHLVPMGEYQPGFLPFKVVPGGGFAAGPGPRTLRPPGVPAVGALICYEVIFPGAAVQEGDRPRWIVNVTNDAWYGDTAGPRQHLAAARMRAVEEGLPLGRAANTGITAAFDGFGRELGRLEWGRAGTVIATLPPPLPPTLFSRAGLIVPWMLALVVTLLGCLPFVYRRPKFWHKSVNSRRHL